MNVKNINSYIYACTDFYGANITCINTDHGLVLVDTPILPDDISEWKKFVLGLNPKGIRFIINTDHHFDHVMGNNQLDSTIIMSQAACEEMQERGESLRERMIGLFPNRTQEEMDFLLSEPLIPAHITFVNELALNLGNCTLKLFHTSGHTRGTICVYIVEDKALIPGDNLLCGMHPYKGQAIFSDWLASLEMLVEFDIDTIIPGHGDVCTKDELVRMRAYFRQLWELTEELVNTGVSKKDAIREIHDRMLSYYTIDEEFKDRMEYLFDFGTARLYDEIKSSR